MLGTSATKLVDFPEAGLVDILWDFENVSVPSSVAPAVAANAVIGVARTFGRVRSSRVFTKHSNISDATTAVFSKCGFTVELQRLKAEEVRAKQLFRSGSCSLD